jgi:uncharacterized membrane protein YhhN
MVLETESIILIGVCLAAAAVHITGIRLVRPLVSGLAKAVASTCFVALAVINGANGSSYGRFILAALMLSWVGDVLLLSRRSSFLLGGIAVFLLAHLAFAAAFTRVAIDQGWLLGSIVCTAISGVLLVRWLWPRLESFYRIAVPAYVAAIMAMASLAIGVSAASMPITVAIGAIMFAISDVSVAKDRFIESSFVNKVWGLPLYYVAQLLLAASVMAIGR